MLSKLFLILKKHSRCQSIRKIILSHNIIMNNMQPICQ